MKQDRRQALADFLKTRRARLAPQEVGLPAARRRRTRGLRREEVAQLAGVGVTWYTWLEQGRDINASPQVLAAITRALLFDPQERTHLFTLAGVPDDTVAEECRVLAPTVQVILDQLEPFPALAVNGRYDLIAFNRIWASGFPDVTSLPNEDRNCLWLMFMEPAWRKVVVDWEDASARMVAQ